MVVGDSLLEIRILGVMVGFFVVVIWGDGVLKWVYLNYLCLCGDFGFKGLF